MERAFQAKAQEVLSGKTTLIATSNVRTRPILSGEPAPGEDLLLTTVKNTAIGAGAGFLFASCELAWYPDWAVDARGHRIDTPWRLILTRVAHSMAFAGLALGTFTFTQMNFEIQREIRDPWNAVYGGFVTGFLGGFSYSKRIDRSIASGLALGVGMGLADLAGFWWAWEPEQPPKKIRAKKYQEGEELRALKELYPKYKDI